MRTMILTLLLGAGEAAAQVFNAPPSTAPLAVVPSTGPLTSPTTSPFAAPTTTTLGVPTTGAQFNDRIMPLYPYQIPRGGLPTDGTRPPASGPGTTPPAATPGTTAPQAPGTTAPGTAPGTAPPPPPPQTRWNELRRLDEQNFDSRRRLDALYKKRKRAILASEEWIAASRSERKAKLNALKDEFRRLEERLRAEYRRRRAEIVSTQVTQGGRP